MAEGGSTDEDSSEYSYGNLGIDDEILYESERSITHHQPSSIKDAFWLNYHTEKYRAERPKIFGKWLLFKHYDEIDQLWEKIRRAIAEDELQGCLTAKCSTMRYCPSCEGPGPSTKAVICVYTEEHNMDDIGFKLIEIAKQDTKYKTDQDTLSYKYTHAGCGKVTIKTIFWNNGKPSFVCEDKPCYATSFKREDIWHLNVVTAPEPFCSRKVHGRWILYLEYDELTELWHLLKDLVESKDKNFGIVRMVCPPKRNRSSPKEQPVFHVHTSSNDRESVGKKLIKLLEQDIDYECKPQYRDLMRGVTETLYWNEGEPDYERIRRKGITKNWRTGEEL